MEKLDSSEGIELSNSIRTKIIENENLNLDITTLKKDLNIALLNKKNVKSVSTDFTDKNDDLLIIKTLQVIIVFILYLYYFILHYFILLYITPLCYILILFFIT